MTKPVRPEDLLNPFVLPFPAPLFEVVRAVQGSELPASRKRDLLSAVKRYCEITGQDAGTAPADVASIRRTLDQLHPAKLGLSPKTWSNLRSNLLGAIEAAGVAPVLQTARICLSPAWEDFRDRMPDRRSREGLSRFMRFCTHNAVDPQAVSLGVLQVFGHALRTSSLARHADTVERSTATLWNRVVDRRNDPSLARLELADRRAAPTRITLDKLPDSFTADLKAHLEWAAVLDPFAENARSRPLSKSSVHLREQHILTALSCLVGSGFQPESIKTLADLVTPAAFSAILRQRQTTGEKTFSAYDEAMAKTLVALGTEWVRPEPLQLEKLKRLRSKVRGQGPGLTQKNKALLREFSDQQVLQKLLRLPDTLWRKIERQPVSLRTLANAQAALAIAILPFAPLRIANLAALAFGVTIFMPARDDQPTLIEIPGSETKNRQPYSIELPPHVTKMLRWYHAHLLTPSLQRRPAYVFDTGDGAPKRAVSLSWLIQRTLFRHLGIHMTAHQFRHLMAEMILANDTSTASFEMVRQLLGHRNLSTTINFYAGQNTLRAGRRHADLLEKQMAATGAEKGAATRKKPCGNHQPKGGRVP